MKLSAAEQKYITSERFIHDDLVRKCGILFETARQLWRSKKSPNQVLVWPSEPLQTEDGVIDEEIFVEILPGTWQDKAVFNEKMKRLVQTTKAYGLLIIELKPDALTALFESHHGTHSWRARIEYHGDIEVLGKTVESTDAEYNGLLWSPSQGTA